MPDVLACKKLLYADDLKIFHSVRTLESCGLIQRSLDSLVSWCEANKLTLNQDKCKVLTFSRKKETVLFPYRLESVILERVQFVSDLGVTFQSDFSFRLHIDGIVKSANKMLGFILRNSASFVNPDTLKTLYFSYVRSKLEYCAIVWNPRHDIYVRLVESCQRRFLKYLYFRMHGNYPPRGYEHQFLLEEFGFISLEKRRTYILLSYLRNLVGGEVDCPELLHMLSFRIPRDVYGRSRATFSLPRVTTDIMLNSPIYRMCRLYNSLAEHFDLFSDPASALTAAVYNS